MDQIAEAGLQKLVIFGIEASVTELEVEILTVLASKASQIRAVEIINLTRATLQVRQALAVMVVDIIKLRPP